MGVFLRQFFAILALPGVVAVMVPVWIARSYGLALTTPETLGGATVEAARGLGRRLPAQQPH